MKTAFKLFVVIILVAFLAVSFVWIHQSEERIVELEDKLSNLSTDTTVVLEETTVIVDQPIEDTIVETTEEFVETTEWNRPSLLLWEDSFVKIYSNELMIDSDLGAQLWLTIENKTDRTLRVKTCDTAIEGYLFTTFCDVILDPNSIVQCSVRFLATDLLVTGIQDISEIELYFTIKDGTYHVDLSTTPVIIISFE